MAGAISRSFASYLFATHSAYSRSERHGRRLPRKPAFQAVATILGQGAPLRQDLFYVVKKQAYDALNLTIAGGRHVYPALLSPDIALRTPGNCVFSGSRTGTNMAYFGSTITNWDDEVAPR
jgi:hypothetical protein